MNKWVNNMNIETTGGVSPLKRRQTSRGGKFAGRATSTAARRGGFARSAGKRGAGGRNVGGYNVYTSFTPAGKWTPPASGGVINIPVGSTPITDELLDPSKKYTDPVYKEIKEKVKKPGVDKFKRVCYDKDGNFLEGQIIEGMKCEMSKDPNYSDYETKVTKKEVTPGFWTYYDGNGNEISESKYNELLKKSSPNKMSLGGYRAMHGTTN